MRAVPARPGPSRARGRKRPWPRSPRSRPQAQRWHTRWQDVTSCHMFGRSGQRPPGTDAHLLINLMCTIIQLRTLGPSGRGGSLLRWCGRDPPNAQRAPSAGSTAPGSPDPAVACPKQPRARGTSPTLNTAAHRGGALPHDCTEWLSAPASPARTRALPRVLTHFDQKGRAELPG